MSYAPSSPPSYAPSSPPSYAPSALPWDIQNRRLPEPPPLKAGSPDPCYTEAYELPKLPPGQECQGFLCMLYVLQFLRQLVTMLKIKRTHKDVEFRRF